MPKKANQLVKESNNLARARIMPATTTVWDERIISSIAAKNRVEDTEFHEQTIDARTLAATEKLSTVQFQEVKRSVRALSHKTYEIPSGRRGIIIYPIFAKIAIDDNGVITARFNPDLKEHYLELRRQFSVRLLPEFKALTSTYSQQLYRYLNSWKNSVDTTAELIFLHEILAVPPSFRKDFRQFRTRVLEPAHREILSQTGLVYAWEPIKRGQRKVVAVRFIFDIERASLAAKSESQKQAEAETVFELQRLSNQCFESLKRLKHPCEPKKSKKCDYCTTRGRMFAQRIVEEAQGRLPFEDLIAKTASS